MNAVESLVAFIKAQNAHAQPRLLKLYSEEPKKKPEPPKVEPPKGDKPDRVVRVEQALAPKGYAAFGCHQKRVVALAKALLPAEEAALLEIPAIYKEGDADADAEPAYEIIDLPPWSSVVLTDETEYEGTVAIVLKTYSGMFLLFPSDISNPISNEFDELRHLYRPATPEEIESALEEIDSNTITEILRQADDYDEDLAALSSCAISGDFSTLKELDRYNDKGHLRRASVRRE